MWHAGARISRRIDSEVIDVGVTGNVVESEEEAIAALR